MIDRLPPFVRSATFRLTVFAAVAFAGAASLLLFYVYMATAVAFARQTDIATAQEMAQLAEAFDAEGGLRGLNRAVIERSVSDGPFSYLLIYPSGRALTGNVDAMPDEAAGPDGVVRFAFRQDGEDDVRRARGRTRTFPGGFRLLVFQDVEDNRRITGRIAREAWTAGAFMLAAALGLGALLTQRFVRRVDALNAVAGEVRAGDLQARAPRNGSGDELDALSGNVNAMLDRIEGLMTSMRHAGDSIAHDLRTPLTRMRSRLETALSQAEDGPSREALERAVSDADELLTTFNAVLRIARLEAGEKRGALEDMDLAAVADDLGELYDPVCEEQGVSFSVERPPHAAMRGDRGLVSQAVANLLDNAVKYTPSGGAIALRVRRRRSGEFEISVTDTGPGVPAADRERVKQRFVRLDASRSQAGAGLGLALVQAVADLHGGRFELDEGPGRVDGQGPGLWAALIFPLSLAVGARM